MPRPTPLSRTCAEGSASHCGFKGLGRSHGLAARLAHVHEDVAHVGRHPARDAQLLMHGRDGTLPLVPRCRPLHVGVTDEVDKHKFRWHRIELVEQIGMRQTVGVLVEAIQPVTGVIEAQAALRLAERLVVQRVPSTSETYPVGVSRRRPVTPASRAPTGLPISTSSDREKRTSPEPASGPPPATTVPPSPRRPQPLSSSRTDLGCTDRTHSLFVIGLSAGDSGVERSAQGAISL